MNSSIPKKPSGQSGFGNENVPLAGRVDVRLRSLGHTSANGRPGVKFVGDIADIHTWQGFMRTELVADALMNAAATTRIEPSAIWLSAGGSVHTSTQFRALVAGRGMRSSMGRTGACWDNSMAESYFSALKNEPVYRTNNATQSQARIH